MPIVKTLSRGLKYFYGVLLALYVMAPAYAFGPSQVPLLSASVVPSNVMLLIDNSGSMTHLTRPADYSDNTDYGRVFRYLTCGRLNCTLSGELTSENNYYSDFNSSSCSGSTYSAFYDINGTLFCFSLPNAKYGSNTLYSANYLAYLIAKAKKLGQTTVNYRNASLIPQLTRMEVAKSVSTALVVDNPGVRMGLATLNTGNSSRIKFDVADISATGTNSPAEKLKAAIDDLYPSGGTALAETYYEITRYFRQMSSYSPSGINYTSPIQYRCQKNYGVVVTDGLPSNDRDFPSTDPEYITTTPVMKLPNWDNSTGSSDGPKTGTNADGDTLYLDDVAKFAYDIDMRKPTSTPALDLAKKNWNTDGFLKQNMNTYTIGFALTNQMMIDAASYGHGTYFQADDIDQLSTALKAVLSEISSKAGSGGAGAANSTTLVAGTIFYQTLYDPADWHGTIKAFNLDSTSGALNNQRWSTDDTIKSANAIATPYKTWNTDGNGAAIDLEYLKLSATQRTALDQSIPGTIPVTTGTNLISWAKGNAITGLRTRSKYLGDIVNSTLATALPKDQTSTEFGPSTDYSTFLTNKLAKMVGSLVVNANDGFMHVIDADSGAQRFAYMPSTVLPSLYTLATADYAVSKHRFTVDGPISVFDTQATSTSSWRTVAFGGTGAGGKAYFAVKLFEGVDSTPSVLWEIKAPDTPNTNNPFNNLGYAYSKPEVARMADGTGIVVLGNGYGSSTQKASLFVLNANTGALIREIPVPPMANDADNGLSSVKLKVNSQNVVQAAYAGDLKGRLWKFDMSGAAATGWGVAFGGKPLFSAPLTATTTTVAGTTTTTYKVQPITAQPLLIDHPVNGKMVYVGTGKFSEIADKTTSDPQAFYAIWDKDGGTGDITPATLQAQAISNTVKSNNNTYFTTTNNDVDWAVKNGWYLPLSTTDPYVGERIIYPAQTSRDRIIFTTAAVSSPDPCESVGIGRLFELDAAKGGMLSYQVLDTNGDSDVTSTDTIVSAMSFNTGIPNLASIVAGVSSTNDNKYVLDSSGAGVLKIVEKGGTANIYQRIMWRQIQ